MKKIINLFGIRRRVKLCRIKEAKDVVAIMQPITEEQEQELDKFHQITIDGNVIKQDNIYVYGQLNLDCEDDINYINKFNLLNTDDTGNIIYSNINWSDGTVEFETVPKQYATWDKLLWFEYNYMLIGRPERVIIYKINKSLL